MARAMAALPAVTRITDYISPGVITKTLPMKDVRAARPAVRLPRTTKKHPTGELATPAGQGSGITRDRPHGRQGIITLILQPKVNREGAAEDRPKPSTAGEPASPKRQRRGGLATEWVSAR